MLGNARECILGFLSPGDLSLTSVVYTELMLFSDPYGGIWFLRLWCRQSLAHKYMHFKNELKEFKRLWLWSTMRERITIYTYRERVRGVVCVHWIPNAIRRVDASWFISKQHIHSHTHNTHSDWHLPIIFLWRLRNTCYLEPFSLAEVWNKLVIS